MNKIIATFAVALSASLSFASLQTNTLTKAMVGTVLLDHQIYAVNGDVVLDARTMPGISALRVPVGAETVIYIGKGSKLTVYGGPGYGIISGGAGIEVPPGAKLVVCGDGELIAYGGAAAQGGTGYGGRAGLFSEFVSPAALADGLLPRSRDQLPNVGYVGGLCSTNIFSTPLKYGRAGSGGNGGEGGGGGGAGIGGRGGWGGSGGVGGVNRCVVPDNLYDANKQRYLDCEKYFAMTNRIPFYKCDLRSNFALSGTPGSVGHPGKSGNGGGDVVFAGNVKVEAYAGGSSALTSADGGPVGAQVRFDHYDINTAEKVQTGLTIGSELVSTVGEIVGECESETAQTVGSVVGKVGTAVGVVTTLLDELGVFAVSKLKTIHYYTGGGGGQCVRNGDPVLEHGKGQGSPDNRGDQQFHRRGLQHDSLCRRFVFCG